MNTPERDNPMDRDLWRRYRRGAPPGEGQELAPLDLAAYLDALGGEPDRGRIESHLADSAQARRALVEVADLLRAPAMTVPPAVLNRAKSLAPGAERSVWRRLGSWVGVRAGGSRFQIALRWAAATAAAVLIGFAGYFAGQSTYHSQQEAETALVTEMSFELAGAEADPLLSEGELDALLPLNGGAK